MNLPEKSASDAIANTSDSLATTWVSLQTIKNVLSTYDGRIRRLVAQGKIRNRRLEGMHAQYALEDALTVRQTAQTNQHTS
jgi:hypothetical protein